MSEEQDDIEQGATAEQIQAAGIDPRFIVHLKNKAYPTWAGVLDAATKSGLVSLTTAIEQIPSAANGHLAVVSATAVFADGRTFSDVGDCSPESSSPQLATAALRFASTRAKGRVLRDAQNVGFTMLEEMPSGGGARPQQQQRPQANGQQKPAQQAASGDQAVCSEPGCGLILTKNQVTMSQHKAKAALCSEHLKARSGT